MRRIWVGAVLSGLFSILSIPLGLTPGGGRVQTAAAVAPAAPKARSWLTTGDATSLLTPQSPARFGVAKRSALKTVAIDDSVVGQSLTGYGAALTDSSAWLLSQLPAAAQDKVLNDLFSPSAASGAALSVLRVPLGASDFVVGGAYSYDDQPVGVTDPTLSGFSIDRDRSYLIPLLVKIRAIRPDLHLMATPWSAPGWMKSSGSLIGGSLLPAHEGAYARYLALSLKQFAAAGAPIDTLTVQNEPGWAPADYPGMVMPVAQQARFVADHLAPALTQAGLNPSILGYGHNWDDTAYPISLLQDARAGSVLTGVAFHCYAGDVSAQSAVHAAVADASIWMTECSGGDWGSGFAGDLVWGTRNLVVGAGRNWATGVLWWNLALDRDGGPHTGGCTGCRGIITVDPSTGAVSRNVEYWTAAHATVAVQAGAVRVASTTFGPGDVETVAWRNPDGSHALVAVNSGTSSRKFQIRWKNWTLQARLAPGAVATWSW